jgi:hypothetical protein
MPLILHVGGIYMTDALAVYEVVEYSGDNAGFCFLARPCRFTAPFRPLEPAVAPMQWFTLDGYWHSLESARASDLDLSFLVGERKDYPCAG